MSRACDFPPCDQALSPLGSSTARPVSVVVLGRKLTGWACSDLHARAVERIWADWSARVEKTLPPDLPPAAGQRPGRAVGLVAACLVGVVVARAVVSLAYMAGITDGLDMRPRPPASSRAEA